MDVSFCFLKSMVIIVKIKIKEDDLQVTEQNQ